MKKEYTTGKAMGSAWGGGYRKKKRLRLRDKCAESGVPRGEEVSSGKNC